MTRVTTIGLLSLALAGAMPLFLHAGDVATYHPAANVRNALDTTIPEINVESTPLSKVIDFLRDYTGTNVVVSWNVLEAANVTKDTPISLRLVDAPMSKILKTVLDQASPTVPLTYSTDHNVLTITTQEAADKVLVTKVLVIEDLLMQPNNDIKPPTFDLQQATQTATGTSTTGGGGGGSSNSQSLFKSDDNSSTTEKTIDDKGQEIVKLIEDTVRPDIWSEKGGPATIRYLSGRLIVTAPQSVLDMIGD